MTPVDPLADFPIVVEVDVRYRDLDTFNHVNNAVYLTYFEQARVAYFARLGWTSRDDSVVVARAEVNYRRAIVLGQKVRVGCRVARFGNKSYTMEYLVLADGEPAADGSTVQAYVQRGRGAPLPEELKRRILDVEAEVGRRPE
ncbi:thioesterase family protein [Oceanithermus sp.]|uniref:acyl-CoA thioesterase n=1 Tax=Oceanithermus sp. TaxID=2268145 RepID=UPI00257C3FC1|nr:thioesterase family protein [Oceanithermus sp.]